MPVFKGLQPFLAHKNRPKSTQKQFSSPNILHHPARDVWWLVWGVKRQLALTQGYVAGGYAVKAAQVFCP